MSYTELKVSIFKTKLIPQLRKSAPFDVLPVLVIGATMSLHIEACTLFNIIFFSILNLVPVISHKVLWSIPSHYISPISHAISIFCLSHCIGLPIISWSFDLH